MDDVNFSRFILSFLFVIGLIGCLAFLLKYFAGKQKWLGMSQPGGRIQVVETRYLDPRRRLVLVKRDDKEHLLLLAADRELVIETGINSPMMENEKNIQR